jgi:hypothetical protein
MNEETTGGVHWSFWIIGAGALIWNGMGVMNFIMQMNPETLANYPEPARVLVGGRPTWATGGFAIAVFGGTLGCLLLLLRQGAAFHVFVASLLGVILAAVHAFGLAGSTTVASPQIWVGTLMSLVVAALLIWYSKRAKGKGWIR